MERRVATADDLRKVLAAEHRHLWELVRAVRHAPILERARPFARLLHYLAVHEAAEQAAMHNVHVNDVTRERIDEENEAADLVDRLTRADLASDDFEVVLDQLERVLRAHAEAEENDELDVLAEVLTPDELGEIHRALLMIREIAEDPASPVPSGSFAMMMLASMKEFSALSAQVR